MKYWNKTKEVRLRCWTKITLQHNERPGILDTYDGWYSWHRYTATKCVLQNDASTSKFFMTIRCKDIWFENSQDALKFKLSYGHK